MTTVSNQCVIFDLDGTFCDLSDEYLALINIEPKNWKAFEEHIPHDEPCKRVKLLYRMLMSEGFTIVILTARPERCREATVAWLKKHNVHYSALYMRNEGFHGTDADSKEAALKIIREDHGEIFMAFEDRPHVIEMFIRNNVFVCDVGQQKELTVWAQKKFAA